MAIMAARAAGAISIADPAAQNEQALLDLAKERLSLEIDAAAEQQRLRWITPGAGQALVYTQKAAEAARAVVDPSPTAETYPLLAASRAGSETIADVANVVLETQALWVRIAAEIEAARLGGKAAIAAAATAAAARAAADAVAWPEGAP